MSEKDDPESSDSLVHYGVKGMRWGHRKKEETGSDSSSIEMPVKKSSATSADVDEYLRSIENATSLSQIITLEEYMAVKMPPTNSAAELQKNTEKFIAKSDPSGSVAEGSPKDGLTPEQKRTLIKIGVGALAVGAVVGYSAYKIKSDPAIGFKYNCTKSKLNSWNGSGFIKDSSWDRPEFELPAGHTFHRISRVAENGFNPATYTTHSLEDFHRYAIGFSGELGPGAKLHHVTWKAQSPVKVPNLKTTLDTLQEVMEQTTGLSQSPERVMHRYQEMSGGRWDSGLATSFFEKLSAKGFGAIVDEMDAGVIGETPLVLFATNAMSPKNAAPLTSDAMKAAATLVQDFPKPPRK